MSPQRNYSGVNDVRIYLRTGEVLLSKKHYSHWKEIQDKYEHYMTDLSYESCEDLIGYFELDFGDESRWPFP